MHRAFYLHVLAENQTSKKSNNGKRAARARWNRRDDETIHQYEHRRHLHYLKNRTDNQLATLRQSVNISETTTRGLEGRRSQNERKILYTFDNIEQTQVIREAEPHRIDFDARFGENEPVEERNKFHYDLYMPAAVAVGSILPDMLSEITEGLSKWSDWKIGITYILRFVNPANNEIKSFVRGTGDWSSTNPLLLNVSKGDDLEEAFTGPLLARMEADQEKYNQISSNMPYQGLQQVELCMYKVDVHRAQGGGREMLPTFLRNSDIIKDAEGDPDDMCFMYAITLFKYYTEIYDQYKP